MARQAPRVGARMIAAVVDRTPPWALNGTCAAIERLAEVRVPARLAAPLTRAALRLLGVDDESVAPEQRAQGFRSAGEFFARDVAPGARPFRASPGLGAPCDGLVEHVGRIDDAARFDVKGRRLGVASLVGDDALAGRLRGGCVLVFYLSPRDYHGVHAPASARCEAVRAITGRRLRVDAAGVARVRDVVLQNARCVFELATDHGTIVVVMVGAFGVSAHSLEVVAATRAAGDRGGARTLARLVAGDLIGRFRLGSTVVLLASNATAVEPVVPVGRHVRAGSLVARWGTAS